MHIIIVGAGKVGEYLARTTLESGNDVVVIESDHDRAVEMATALSGRVLVIFGDGCNSRVMEDADIRHADVFVATTGRDDNNLVACEIALRVFKVNRCIARVNNPKNLRIFRKLGIECVSSTTLIGRLIEEEATLGNLNAVSTLAQGNIAMVEVKVREFRSGGLSPINGASVYDDVDYPDEALPVAVVHDGTPQLIDEDTRVVPGDTVIIATPTELIPD
ncbi:MAG: TrkA family potassium uptake protein, partial [Coriobacteriaceae bacterium]|nr:TrkA family potassium uptake protein [Coriobacteriaceae bacterium]